MKRVVVLSIACLIVTLAQRQTMAPATGTPVEMVVTVGHYYTPEAPLLKRGDLVVTQQYKTLPVTSVTPLRDARGGLELFLLVDNCSNCEPGSKIDEIRQFIISQPASTAIGIAYIQNGKVQITQKPTFDHELAFGSLSAPSGSNPASPFVALTSLINDWKQTSARRAVLMISTGVDPGTQNGQLNPLVEAAIEAAQRGAVTVYAIYHPSADYGTADVSKIYSGQVQLAHLASETGGEAYFTNFGPLPSLGPLLVDIAHHLSNQYLVKFMATPSDTPGGALEQIFVKSATGGVILMAPDRVWVPGRVGAGGPSSTGSSR